MSEAKLPNDVDRFVGQRVRQARRALKLTQEQLGERLGLTFQQVQKYEKGVNRISAGRLHELAQALNRPLDFFYPEFELRDGDYQDLDAAVELHELRDRVLKAIPKIDRIDLLRALALMAEHAVTSHQQES